MSFEPRNHCIWFVHNSYPAVLSKVNEIFVDATHKVSKAPTYLYSIVGCEQGYGIPLGFMLMSVRDKQDDKETGVTGQVTRCIRNFFAKAKELGLNPRFVHTDKDFGEITAAQVTPGWFLHGSKFVQEVWPDSAISLCIWHVRKALKDYLRGDNAWVLSGNRTHDPIAYGDADRWGQDASFLDTRWVQRENIRREDSFTKNVMDSCPEDSTDEFKRAWVMEEIGKKQQVCSNEAVRTRIFDMVDSHCRWHPLLANPNDREEWSEDLMWVFWRAQVTEMHQLCQTRGQSWAWEYLWRQWYNPHAWKLWARAAHPQMPLINSNAVVEAMWGALKKWYLKKHAKAPLELLGEILMKQYLRDRAQHIYFHRIRQEPPPAYKDFVAEWRKCGTRIEEDDAEVEEPETLFNRAVREYGTDIQTWWCGCLYYKGSTNHICKHLIRFYTQWNNAPAATTIAIPLWGQVFRQSTSPAVFIQGLHSEEEFTTRGLWPLVGEGHHAQDLRQPGPIVEDEDLGLEGGAEGGDQRPTPDPQPDPGDDVGNRSGDEMQRLNERNIREIVQTVAHDDQVAQGRQIHRQIDRTVARLEKLVVALKEAREYPAGHAHLREIPTPDVAHYRAWESYIRRQEVLANARVMRPTWNAARAGHLFA